MNDDFYIGYARLMPDSIARVVRPAALTLVALALTVPGLLVFAQSRFSTAAFEFGQPRTYEGRLVEFPYPALEVPGRTGSAPDVYWLVGPGKHGAADMLRGLDGRAVRLEGTLIQRDADRMLQVEAGAVSVLPGALPQPSAPTTATSMLEIVGPVALTGEIVDSKCHLGVMKPGEGPAHRDCAVRCLLGSVPPMFVVHERGTPRRLALLTPDGRPFTGDFSRLAGRPLAVHGVLLRRGGREFLAAGVDRFEELR